MWKSGKCPVISTAFFPHKRRGFSIAFQQEDRKKNLPPVFHKKFSTFPKSLGRKNAYIFPYCVIPSGVKRNRGIFWPNRNLRASIVGRFFDSVPFGHSAQNDAVYDRGLSDYRQELMFAVMSRTEFSRAELPFFSSSSILVMEDKMVVWSLPPNSLPISVEDKFVRVRTR